jgi:GNAT superfamily N-acetyltransferase
MIKMATIEDLENLSKLRIALLNEARNYDVNYDWSGYSKTLNEYYSRALVNGNAVAFLAYEGDKAIAMITICFYNIVPSISNLEGKMAVIADMYTLYEYRNQGIGKSLLDEIMKYSKSNGYMRVTLNATDRGRKLYEKYGFMDIMGEMAYKLT